MFARFGGRWRRDEIVLDKHKLERELGHVAKGLTVRLLGYVATLCSMRDPLVRDLADRWEKDIHERISAMLRRAEEGSEDE